MVNAYGEDYYTTAEAATILKVKKERVQAYVRNGSLPAISVRNVNYIPESGLKSFLGVDKLPEALLKDVKGV